MGLYLRQSVRVGPLRFNLSNSGVGISVGLPGFRVGSGPRGNYVQMGAHGIYYRASLSAPRPRSSPTPRQAQRPPSPELPYNDPDRTHEPLIGIESGDTADMEDSSSKALLEEIRQKQRALRLFPLILCAAIATVVASILMHWPQWASIVAAVVGFAALLAAILRDTLRKSVVVLYNLDASAQNLYRALHEAAEDLGKCSGIWHVEAAGAVRVRKYHAGASALQQRKSTFISKLPPEFLRTNIATIALGVGRQTLYFFPDRVLVYDHGDVGAIAYRDLRILIRPTRFIEEGTVPPDTKIVGNTWRFVNKNGGPDLRFKNNRQLPVCLYEEIALTSNSGLNELIQVSRTGAAIRLLDAISRLSRALPAERSLDTAM